MEKKLFDFYQDIKVSVWVRQKFSIEAESKEEAIKEALKYKSMDVDGGNISIYNCEWMHDTWSEITVEENGGFSTIELYDEETNELIGCNGKS